MSKLRKILSKVTERGIAFFSYEGETYIVEQLGSRLYTRPLCSSIVATDACVPTLGALYMFLRKYYDIDFRKVKIM